MAEFDLGSNGSPAGEASAPKEGGSFNNSKFRGAWRDHKGEWHVSGRFEDRRFGGMFPSGLLRPLQSPTPQDKTPLVQPKAKSQSEADRREYLVKLQELYQVFYGRWAKAGKLAPELSPLIKDLETEARALGARSSDIEKRREDAMRSSGYDRLLSQKRSSEDFAPVADFWEEKKEPGPGQVVGVILQSGEILSLRREDIPILAELLTELEGRRIAARQAGEKEDSLLAAEISQVRDALMQLKVSGMLSK